MRPRAGQAPSGGEKGAALDVNVHVERASSFHLDVALRAKSGATVAVMGPSGAGKSTLLDAIAGHVALACGHVRLDDREVSGPGGNVPAHQRGVVLLGQDPRLFPHLSALDNVAFGIRAQGASRQASRQRAAEWLMRVGLADASGRRPSELSGGQQQRVALARALGIRPGVVLLDEPFTALDPETADDLREVVADALSATALVVTHNAIDAISLASHVVVIERGAVVQYGEVRDVFAAPATGFVATLSGVNRVEGIVRDGVWVAGALVLDAPGQPDGAVAALFRPGEVSLGYGADASMGAVSGADEGARVHTPAGSGLMVAWPARVTRVEQTLAGVRVHTDVPRVWADVELSFLAGRRIRVGDEVELRLPARAPRFVATA